MSTQHSVCPYYRWLMLLSALAYIFTSSHETGDDSLHWLCRLTWSHGTHWEYIISINIIFFYAINSSKISGRIKHSSNSLMIISKQNPVLLWIVLLIIFQKNAGDSSLFSLLSNGWRLNLKSIKTDDQVLIQVVYQCLMPVVEVHIVNETIETLGDKYATN